jgi:hypothetical protein
MTECRRAEGPEAAFLLPLGVRFENMHDNKQKEGRLTFRAWFVSQGGSQ